MIKSRLFRIVSLGIASLLAGVIADRTLLAEPAGAPSSRAAKPASTTRLASDAGGNQSQVVVEADNPAAMYANFCRVTGTPEEVILDFGLNPSPFGVPKDPISVQQRTVLNFYTAKRMLSALELTIKRHEDAFGVIETDVQKRVKRQE